ncbi:MAG: tryptophan synthase subunit alpha, partial [Deltaproteobacteria bacterium]|nr:tryptophan synthase subunit alpha [Deltaproteobacteria bacterium]
FVYAVTLRGVTGATLDAGSGDLAAQLQSVRAHATRPVVAGFGVRTPEQAAALARHADGVVVGSALIEASQRGEQELARTVAALRAALSAPQESP